MVEHGRAGSRPRRRRRSVVVALAVAAVLGLGVAAVVVGLRHGVDDLRERLMEVRPPVDPLDAVPAVPGPAQTSTAGWDELDGVPFGEREAVTWAAGDRYLLAWGGADRDRPTAPLDDGAVFDTATGRWRPLGPFPDIVGRRSAGAVVEGDVAWVVGGRVADDQGSTAPTGEVVRIDLAEGDAEVVATDDRAARAAPVVARAGDALVVSGGARGRADDLTTAVLDLDDGGWDAGPDLPWPMAAALADRRPGSAPGIATDRAIIGVRSRSGDLTELVRIGLDDLAAAAGLRVVPPTDVARGAVAVAGSSATVVVVGAGDDLNMVGIDRPTGRIRWQGTTPVPECDGSVAAVTAGDIAVLHDTCANFGAIDAENGVYGRLDPPPTVGADDGRLVAVAGAVLWVDPGAPGAGVTAALVAR